MYNKHININKIVMFFITVILINRCTEIYANSYTINELIENGKEFDRKEITIQGEAIGESLKREEHTWININDSSNAIGIYMKNEDANKVDLYGGYSKIGDTIQVKGIFNRACKEHGGDMDIHANEIEVIKKGKVLKENINRNKIYLALISSIVVLLLAYMIYAQSK